MLIEVCLPVTYILAKEEGRCVVTGEGWAARKPNREIVPINVHTEREAVALYLGLAILDHLEGSK